MYEYMNRRKEIADEYKRRKLAGGVYVLTNALNGKYLIDHASNLKSIQNRFEFAVTTGLTFHPKLQKDWDELGAQAFTLKVLEELAQKPEQTQADFMDELEILEHLCRTNLDPLKEY